MNVPPALVATSRRLEFRVLEKSWSASDNTPSAVPTSVAKRIAQLNTLVSRRRHPHGAKSGKQHEIAGAVYGVVQAKRQVEGTCKPVRHVGGIGIEMQIAERGDQDDRHIPMRASQNGAHGEDGDRSGSGYETREKNSASGRRRRDAEAGIAIRIRRLCQTFTDTGGNGIAGDDGERASGDAN